MKRTFIFSCLFACLAIIAFPALTTPAAAAADPVFKVYTERIEPVTFSVDPVATLAKRTDAAVVYSSFTMQTPGRSGYLSGNRTGCPGFLIGAGNDDKRTNHRALAVPWCRVSR